MLGSFRHPLLKIGVTRACLNKPGKAQVIDNVLISSDKIGEIWLLRYFRISTEFVFILELSLLKPSIIFWTSEGDTGEKKKGLSGDTLVK